MSSSHVTRQHSLASSTAHAETCAGLVRNRTLYSFTLLESGGCIYALPPHSLADLVACPTIPLSVSSKSSPCFHPSHSDRTCTPPCPALRGLALHPSYPGMLLGSAGDVSSLTIGLCSYRDASSSCCVRTGVTQASVSSKIDSQCARDWDLKIFANWSRNSGHEDRSSLSGGYCSP